MESAFLDFEERGSSDSPRRVFRTEIELALPIYKLQPADSTKFLRVVSDKRQITLKSNRSYLQIVRSDQCTISFQLSANPGTSMRAGIVEWQRDEGFQKYIKFRMFACWVRTAFSAMAKLVDDHRTKHDIGRPGRLPSRHQAWRAPTQQANASVGVGKENHSRGRRCSNCPWSHRRNSSMEPATVSKKFFGQPFSSKSDASGIGLT